MIIKTTFRNLLVGLRFAFNESELSLSPYITPPYIKSSKNSYYLDIKSHQLVRINIKPQSDVDVYYIDLDIVYF